MWRNQSQLSQQKRCHWPKQFNKSYRQAAASRCVRHQLSVATDGSGVQRYSVENFERLEQEATVWQRNANATAENILRMQLREATHREVELETELENARAELSELRETF